MSPIRLSTTDHLKLIMLAAFRTETIRHQVTTQRTHDPSRDHYDREQVPAREGGGHGNAGFRARREESRRSRGEASTPRRDGRNHSCASQGGGRTGAGSAGVEPREEVRRVQVAKDARLADQGMLAHILLGSLRSLTPSGAFDRMFNLLKARSNTTSRWSRSARRTYSRYKMRSTDSRRRSVAKASCTRTIASRSSSNWTASSETLRGPNRSSFGPRTMPRRRVRLRRTEAWRSPRS